VPRGDSKEKAIMGAAATKPPLAIPPHSKLRGFLAFTREQKTLLPKFARKYLWIFLNIIIAFSV